MFDVSVIIPNYNHGAYLKQRIDSILCQTYQNFEIIILDDCSTDNSREVIDSYTGNPKISHIVFNTINSGSPFLQWEKGINIATGKYVWIAESDDWCEPSLLEVLVEGIQKDDECVISYCQMACIIGDNNIKWQSFHKRLWEIVDSKTFIQDYVAINVAIYNASMAIFRRDSFKNINRDFTTYKFSGDRVFWIQMAMQGKTHISGKTLNYFRKHDKDVSGGAFKSGLSFVEELRILNWMYGANLIPDHIYAKAYRKQFKSYWKVRNTIDPKNKELIKPYFRHPLTQKANTLKFLPSAIVGAFKNKEY
jgi:glycosyltransferase involved in cell wall biosynthesis